MNAKYAKLLLVLSFLDYVVRFDESFLCRNIIHDGFTKECDILLSFITVSVFLIITKCFVPDY